MKRGQKTLICLVCASAVTTGVKGLVNDANPAQSGESPYSAIWLRNVFDLKAPSVAPPPPLSNAPPSNVQLTGITTMGGVKRVLIGIQRPGKQDSFILREGERRDGLEIVEINPKTSTVKIKIDDVPSTITFSTNAAPAMAGGPGPMGGGLGQPRPGLPPVNGFNPAPVPLNNGIATPVRPVRPTDYSAGAPQGYMPSAQPAIYGGYTQPVNSGGVNLGGSLFTQPAALQTSEAESPGLPLQQQIAMLITNQQAHAQEIAVGKFPPFPPLPGVADPSPYGAVNQAAPAPPELPSAPATSPNFTPPPPQLPGYLQPKVTGTYKN